MAEYFPFDFDRRRLALGPPRSLFCVRRGNMLDHPLMCGDSLNIRTQKTSCGVDGREIHGRNLNLKPLTYSTTWFTLADGSPNGSSHDLNASCSTRTLLLRLVSSLRSPITWPWQQRKRLELLASRCLDEVSLSHPMRQGVHKSQL